MKNLLKLFILVALTFNVALLYVKRQPPQNNEITDQDYARFVTLMNIYARQQNRVSGVINLQSQPQAPQTFPITRNPVTNHLVIKTQPYDIPYGG